MKKSVTTGESAAISIMRNIADGEWAGDEVGDIILESAAAYLKGVRVEPGKSMVEIFFPEDQTMRLPRRLMPGRLPRLVCI